MKMMILICFPLALVATVLPTTTGTANMAAGRVLRKEIVIAAPLDAVWKAWTTENGLRIVSPKSRVELRLGGPYEWFLHLEPDRRGRRGSEGCRVLAFLPGEVLAFDWTFPPQLESLRYSGAKTQVVLRFDETPDGHVRIRFAQHGWLEGQDWDKGFAYFDQAWDWVLSEMKTQLER